MYGAPATVYCDSVTLIFAFIIIIIIIIIIIQRTGRDPSVSISGILNSGFVAGLLG